MRFISRAWRRLRQPTPFDWQQVVPELSLTRPYDWGIEHPSLAPPAWHDGVRLVEEPWAS